MELAEITSHPHAFVLNAIDSSEDCLVKASKLEVHDYSSANRS